MEVAAPLFYDRCDVTDWHAHRCLAWPVLDNLLIGAQ